MLADSAGDQVEAEALARSVVNEFEGYVKLNKKVSPEVIGVVQQIDDYAKLADAVASHLAVKIPDKQVILETPSVTERLEKVLGLMESEISVLQVEKRIRTRVKRQMEKTQREYYLNEQMKAIQKELGDEDGKDELAEIEEKIKTTKLSKEAREKAQHELKKLRQMSPMSAEATVVRNYLDWLLSIPWNKKSKIKKDLTLAEQIPRGRSLRPREGQGAHRRVPRGAAARQQADRTHSVPGRSPGCGKTSLGKSIARATGREFVRVSLGGVRDEAEIRGHRRTYIGSMPGKIIQSMRKAKTSNPLFLLDEVDKMGADFRGDPSSALLEVLDPEQNHAFNDHYLEVDYDLSHVMFITTANTLNIPPPLMDRMEIIRIAGYTEDEKVEIARKHLIPHAIVKHGLDPKEWSIDDEALLTIIRRYTREAGVRNLERELSTLIRKAVKELTISKKKSVQVTAKVLADYLGVPKFRYGEVEDKDQVGVVTGLAWTDVGGELLTIEAAMMPGKGKMTVTGNLRDVMKESISAAASYVRMRAVAFGIEPPSFDKRDIHVHVPEGATPKDGPSAGVAMVTAIVSVMTGIPVHRDVAMTGEITLRGRVLPIGGLKEKLLAALRGGIKTVLIPEENAKDLVEINDSIKSGLDIIPVSRMDEVLTRALVRKPEPIVWEEATAKPVDVPDQAVVEEEFLRVSPRTEQRPNDRCSSLRRRRMRLPLTAEGRSPACASSAPVSAGVKLPQYSAIEIGRRREIGYISRASHTPRRCFEERRRGEIIRGVRGQDHRRRRYNRVYYGRSYARRRGRGIRRGRFSAPHWNLYAERSLQG